MSREKFTLDPSRSDYLFRAFNRLAHGKPHTIALYYFAASFGVTLLLGLLTGQYHGRNGLAPMNATVLDNINLGIIAPLGAGLLCHLYNTISKSFSALLDDHAIADTGHKDYLAFMARLDRLYNSKMVIIIAVVVSLGINLFNYFNKTESWLGVNGGITGLYGRVIVFINFTLIGLILYKCVVTVYGMREVFRFDVDVKPLHPDRSGGLLPVGQLAIAVNYFVGLFLLFFTLLFTLDQFAANNMVYLGIIVAFYALSPFLLFSSLSKANKVMLLKKEEMLRKLGRTFDFHFHHLNDTSGEGRMDISHADDIIRVKELYSIVESMPVWPFDVRSLTRLVSTLSIPVAPFVVEYISKQFMG